MIIPLGPYVAMGIKKVMQCVKKVRLISALEIVD